MGYRKLREVIKGKGFLVTESNMQRWLDRYQASDAAPKRAIKRGSSDLPTLENLEEHGDYLRGLLEDDPAISFWHLREALKKKGFLVSEQTMRTWFDLYHRKCRRALLKEPIDGLPCLDLMGLLPYEAAFCSNIGSSTKL